MKMKSKTLEMIVLSFIVLTSCHTGNGGENDVRRCVEVVPATEQVGQEAKSYPGRVQESDQINVAFKMGGQIEKIYVRVGQRVTKGQLLAQVESRDYELELRNYEIQYQQLKDEVDRLKTLYEKRSVSKNDYEKAVAGLEQLEIAVEGNRRKVEYTKLYAPASGVITDVYYSAAELVDAGMAVFALLAEREMKVQFDISAADYLQRANFSEFGCRPSFAPDTLFPMRLESITPKADNSQLYRTTLTFAHGADKRLTPGMTVSVEIKVESGKQEETKGICLPVSCVRQDGEENIVWVVDANGVLHRRQVSLGEVTGQGTVYILSGLEGNERVVRAAASLLKEGEQVRVLPEPSVTNVGNLL